MKRFILTIAFAMMALSAYCQNCIKFLGIPVDGSKHAMISKLQEKGYEYDSSMGVLKGEFNGKEVFISIQTINNKVWRIGVLDARDTNEANIKVCFNTLFDQFLNNGKYELQIGNKLTDGDDISYEMSVNSKTFGASFAPLDKSVNGVVWYQILEKYGNYRIGIYYENFDNAANGDDL